MSLVHTQPLADQDRAATEETEPSSITVLCPMYNEESIIAENVRRLVLAIRRLERAWELILVNDGSTDDTLRRAQAATEFEHNVTIVTYKRNRGRGYAIRQGFAHARGDIVVVTESDLSYGDEIVERLVRVLESEEYDAVVASPHCRGGGMENVPFERALLSKVGNAILRCLMPVSLTTYTGMTRAYRRDVIQSLDLESDGKEIHLELVSKLASLGYRIGEISAALTWPNERKRRQSSFRARRYIVSHLLFGIGEAPLFLLGVAGLFSIGLGVILGIYLLILSMSGVSVASRPLIPFSALLVIVGFFILLFGFLARQNKQLERQLHRLQREIRKSSQGDGKKSLTTDL